MFKVGEYVINQNKLIIGQIIRINQERQEAIIKTGKVKIAIGFWNIKKHGKNIIDLIEVGDYVNGYPVKRIPNFNNELCNFDLNTMEWTPLRDIDVYYNILTKEQYMQNCYRLEKVEEER